MFLVRVIFISTISRVWIGIVGFLALTGAQANSLNTQDWQAAFNRYLQNQAVADVFKEATQQPQGQKNHYISKELPIVIQYASQSDWSESQILDFKQQTLEALTEYQRNLPTEAAKQDLRASLELAAQFLEASPPSPASLSGTLFPKNYTQAVRRQVVPRSSHHPHQCQAACPSLRHEPVSPYLSPDHEVVDVNVWGRDDRRPLHSDEAQWPKELRLTPAEKKQLGAVGALYCEEKRTVKRGKEPPQIKKSYNWGTGFIVDIDKLGASSRRNYDIIGMTAHTMYTDEGFKNKCVYAPDLRKRKEWYFIESLVCGSKDTNKASGNDWCFAKLSEKISHRHGALEINFSHKSSWKASETHNSQWLLAGYNDDKGEELTKVATNCRPDDKSKYPVLKKAARKYGHDYSDVIVHSCDAQGGSSGGPLIRRGPQQKLIVEGVHKGTLSKQKQKQKTYEVNKGQANIATKWTPTIEQQLKRVIQNLESR